MAVVPANAEPGRCRCEHFLYYSGAAGLADLLGFDDDAVSDLSLHRVLLQALRGLASIILPSLSSGAVRPDSGSIRAKALAKTLAEGPQPRCPRN
jgi:hypothetical protein